MFDKPQVHFWKVGTGDSTSVVIRKDIVLQVDLKDNADDDNDNTPIVERLVEKLPKVGGTPYLHGFALTHPDQDHINGFEDLLGQVTIGEIWFTPHVIDEYKKDRNYSGPRFANPTIQCPLPPIAPNRQDLADYRYILR